MTKEQFISTIQSLDKIYVIISRVTRLPYVECDVIDYDDKILIFTDEAEGLKRAKDLNDTNRPVINASVDNADVLRLFADSYLYGVNAIEVVANGEKTKFQINDIIQRVDMSHIPVDERPLENPELQLSIIYYLQEARRPAKSRDADILETMDEEVAVNFLRSKYLVALKGIADGGEDGKKKLQLMAIKASDTEAFIPLFADAGEFFRFKDSEDVNASLVSFDDLLSMDLPSEVSGFLLNPVTTAMPLSREYLRRIHDNIKVDNK